MMTFLALYLSVGPLRSDYIPDPILLVHGRNSSFDGDWNGDPNGLYTVFRELYPQGQKNVYGFSIREPRESATSWLSEFASVNGGKLPFRSDISIKLNWFEEARRQYLFTHPDGIPLPGSGSDGDGYSLPSAQWPTLEFKQTSNGSEIKLIKSALYPSGTRIDVSDIPLNNFIVIGHSTGNSVTRAYLGGMSGEYRGEIRKLIQTGSVTNGADLAVAGAMTRFWGDPLLAGGVAFTGTLIAINPATTGLGLQIAAFAGGFYSAAALSGLMSDPQPLDIDLESGSVWLEAVNSKSIPDSVELRNVVHVDFKTPSLVSTAALEMLSLSTGGLIASLLTANSFIAAVAAVPFLGSIVLLEASLVNGDSVVTVEGQLGQARKVSLFKDARESKDTVAASTIKAHGHHTGKAQIYEAFFGYGVDSWRDGGKSSGNQDSKKAILQQLNSGYSTFLENSYTVPNLASTTLGSWGDSRRNTNDGEPIDIRKQLVVLDGYVKDLYVDWMARNNKVLLKNAALYPSHVIGIPSGWKNSAPAWWTGPNLERDPVDPVGRAYFNEIWDTPIFGKNPLSVEDTNAAGFVTRRDFAPYSVGIRFPNGSFEPGQGRFYFIEQYVTTTGLTRVTQQSWV